MPFDELENYIAFEKRRFMGKKISRMTISTEVAGAVVKSGSEKSRLKISVIIVNWNRSELTLRCIESVMRFSDNIAYEIIVVDNGSEQPELELLKNRAPHSTKVIALFENLFFGEANNIGAEASDAEYLLLLNNDVCVTEDTLTSLLRVFDNELCVGAVGPKFLFRTAERRKPVRSYGRMVGPFSRENSVPNTRISSNAAIIPSIIAPQPVF